MDLPLNKVFFVRRLGPLPSHAVAKFPDIFTMTIISEKKIAFEISNTPILATLATQSRQERRSARVAEMNEMVGMIYYRNIKYTFKIIKPVFSISPNVVAYLQFEWLFPYNGEVFEVIEDPPHL